MNSPTHTANPQWYLCWIFLWIHSREKLMQFICLGQGSLPALALPSNRDARSFPCSVFTSPLQDWGASGHADLVSTQEVTWHLHHKGLPKQQVTERISAHESGPFHFVILLHTPQLPHYKEKNLKIQVSKKNPTEEKTHTLKKPRVLPSYQVLPSPQPTEN